MTIIDVRDRKEFRKWLENNHRTASECYIRVKRGQPKDNSHFWYIDAVEEALCFGWIDSTVRNGFQRFTPRRKNGNWSELNKARCIRLKKLGLMTEKGLEVFSKCGEFIIDSEIENELKKANVWDTFNEFPDLYKKIKIGNINFYKKRNRDIYNRMLLKLITETSKGKMYGQWDDYGRLKLII